MKVSAVALTFAAAVTAAGVPKCANTCLQSMYEKATDLGCSGKDDYNCLCASDDFWYGIRDCTNQACAGDGLEDAQKVAKVVCPGKTLSSSLPSVTGSTTPTVSVSTTLTGAALTSTVGTSAMSLPTTTASGSKAGGAAVKSGSKTSSESANAVILTVTMSNSGTKSVITTTEPRANLTGSLASYSTATGLANATLTGAAAGGQGTYSSGQVFTTTETSSKPVSTEAIVTTETSGSQPVTSTIGHSTLYSQVVAAETETAGANGKAATSSSDDGAAMMTAAPLAFAAGAAALFAF
ncbi:hypothetical protein KEM55_006508 [Ascosphaera atra]|nr:hypothetical protein KEM55_006508 [Ascosphaera atra]